MVANHRGASLSKLSSSRRLFCAQQDRQRWKVAEACGIYSPGLKGSLLVASPNEVIKVIINQEHWQHRLKDKP